jgi:hypothetical protein
VLLRARKADQTAIGCARERAGVLILTVRAGRWRVKAQGWYRDPYCIHEDRYFSDGQPTRLVRDGSMECYDPPPPGPPKAELAEVRQSQTGDGNDLRRADDRSAGPAAYDKNAAFWAALDSVAVYGPMN